MRISDWSSDVCSSDLRDGVDWRTAEKIPLATVQAVIKRLKSRSGYTIAEAAAALGATEQWVHDRINDGTVKVIQAKWDRRRTYLSEQIGRASCRERVCRYV